MMVPRFLRLAAAVLLLGLMHVPATGQVPFVRIEEDWELQVLHPDAQLDAPQVTIAQLPGGYSHDLLLQLSVNYGASPSFSRGGYQLRAALGDTEISRSRQLENEVLTIPSETLTWTLFIQEDPQGLYFGVINGQSQSWGAFGGEAIFVPYSASGLTSLAAYHPQNSVNNSEISYAANRVGKLRLTKVRAYSAQGPLGEWTLNADVQ